MCRCADGLPCFARGRFYRLVAWHMHRHLRVASKRAVAAELAVADALATMHGIAYNEPLRWSG